MAEVFIGKVIFERTFYKQMKVKFWLQQSSSCSVKKIQEIAYVYSERKREDYNDIGSVCVSSNSTRTLQVIKSTMSVAMYKFYSMLKLKMR